MSLYVCFRSSLDFFPESSPTVFCLCMFWKLCESCSLDRSHVFQSSSKFLGKRWNKCTEICFCSLISYFLILYNSFSPHPKILWLFQAPLVEARFYHLGTGNSFPCRYACKIFEACILSRACKSSHALFYLQASFPRRMDLDFW